MGKGGFVSGWRGVGQGEGGESGGCVERLKRGGVSAVTATGGKGGGAGR